jgi:hypothetical protein
MTKTILEKYNKMINDFNKCDIKSVIEFVKDESVPDIYKYYNNIFVVAAKTNDYGYAKMMIALIQVEYDINHENYKGLNAYEQLEDMKSFVPLSLLGANADISSEINEINSDGMNDVHRSIVNRDIKKLILLLANGGDPNFPMKDGTLPLSLALIHNKLSTNLFPEKHMAEMFYALVKSGADYSCYNLKSFEKLESAGVIYSRSSKLLKAAICNKLKSSYIDEIIFASDKSLWSKISALLPKQLDIVIENYCNNVPIKIDQINKMVEQAIKETLEECDSEDNDNTSLVGEGGFGDL